MSYITEADLIAACPSEARYRQVTGEVAESSAKFDVAYPIAVDEMESYLRGRYVVPLDEPLPATLKRALAYLTLNHETVTDRQADFIIRGSAWAHEHLEKLATGRAQLTDPDSETGAGQSTGLDVGAYVETDSELETPLFDRSDPNSEYRRRNPQL